jgi:methylenetetrahydrofolate reductase (NADPH)
MNIRELFNGGRRVYSFEVFPPKTNSAAASVNDALAGLARLGPDYISVTYGAGGSGNYAATLGICRRLKELHGVEPLMHLTCAGSSEGGISQILDALGAAGVMNILALRGDGAQEAGGDFQHASDLAAYITRRGGFNVAGACYPEGHTACESLDRDIENLKIKVGAGATHLNTQLFFDNEDFYRFMDKARAAGITVPVQAGIMPVVRAHQLGRIVTLAGVKIPARLSRLFARYADTPEALFDAGINYASEQISDLIAGGAEGIHLYVMNKADVAERVTKNVRSLLG